MEYLPLIQYFILGIALFLSSAITTINPIIQELHNYSPEYVYIGWFIMCVLLIPIIGTLFIAANEELKQGIITAFRG